VKKPEAGMVFMEYFVEFLKSAVALVLLKQRVENA
jgi:hypothetical protein